MKIRGTTLTTPIARHAIPDDSAVSSKPWSSQNTVDKLCPSFTESGAAVTCEPVDGYPLEVAWQKKNLFNEAAWYEGHGFTLQADGSWLCRNVSETCFTNTTKRSGAMYLTATMKTDAETTPFYLIAYYTDGTMSTTLAINKGENTFVTKTLTTDPAKTVDYIKWTYGGAGSYYLKNVMISFVDNVYEPYAETATITRFGKNLVDTDVLLSNCLTKDENGIYHFDGTVAAGSGVIGFNPPIPANTPIHFKFHDFGGYNANSDALLTTSVSFADGTSEGGNWFGVSQNFTNELTFKKKKAVAALQFYKYQPSEDFRCQFSALQAEIGETATAYEPYQSPVTYTADETGKVTGITGSGAVMNLLADSGEITVTGKVSPAAEIEKLKNAILSLGGNL